MAAVAVERGFALVTNNRRDFVRLYARLDLHDGLVILMPSVDAATQPALFASVLDAIAAAGEDIVNTLIEVDATGRVTMTRLASLEGGIVLPLATADAYDVPAMTGETGMRVWLLAIFALVAGAAPAAAAAPILASDLILRNNTATLQYLWRVPPEVGVEPKLFADMRQQGEARLASAKTAADADAKNAKKLGVPFRQYTDMATWTVAADTGRVLAVVAELYGFTGGAHGNAGFDSVIWDKKRQARIGMPDLFTDRAKARAILEPMVCKALAAEQASRRGGRKLGGEFDKCPPLTSATIVPYGGFAPVAYQVQVMFAPYVAGPWVEGAYVLKLGWPEALRPLVKPEYRADLFGEAQ